MFFSAAPLMASEAGVGGTGQVPVNVIQQKWKLSKQIQTKTRINGFRWESESQIHSTVP